MSIWVALLGAVSMFLVSRAILSLVFIIGWRKFDTKYLGTKYI